MRATDQAARKLEAKLPAIDSALRTISTERAGLDALSSALSNGLGEAFCETVHRIRAAKGRVIVTGMGKSGHIGTKIAATLASTGTPAFFVHPSEASHGDLGMITADDVVVALSWSGETKELGDILDYASRFQVTVIALTCCASSTLGRASDICLALPKVEEACPHGLAPTTSSLMQLAIGDAMAVALLEARGFTARDFRVFHPGGKLGAALNFVKDVMHAGYRMPLVQRGTPMSEAMLVMSEKGFGCCGVVDPTGNLLGIVTDGDLRRHMSHDLMTRLVDDIMTASPRTIRPDALVGEALELMELQKIMSLFAVEGRRPVGVIHMHDLLRIGLV
jgi:arabinose-5-phosphate isomerase